jgi:hypothetical protein
VRSRSWAQDSQKEIACSMRLKCTLSHTNEQMTTILRSHDCTQRLTSFFEVFSLSQTIACVT